MNKRFLLIIFGLISNSNFVFAQHDYSKNKPIKKYVYEGDVVYSSGNAAEANLNSTDFPLKDAREISIEKRKRLVERNKKSEQGKSYSNINQFIKTPATNLSGYNQLVTNNDDYKYTQFDANYFNSSKNPLVLQKSNKYKHLFHNSSQSNFCWDQAGAYYQLDPWLLFAVAKVESSFNPQAVNKNNDKRKSTDYGLMQINTYWLPHLAKYGITTQHLFDPCTSIFIGAWIMRENINRLGYNIDGIGAYNSPNLQIRRNYANKVISAYKEVTKDFGY